MVAEAHAHRPGYSVSGESITPVEYQRRMTSSLFCLAPSGHGGGWGIRVGNAVVVGCIPVIVQDNVTEVRVLAWKGESAVSWPRSASHASTTAVAAQPCVPGCLLGARSVSHVADGRRVSSPCLCAAWLFSLWVPFFGTERRRHAARWSSGFGVGGRERGARRVWSGEWKGTLWV